MLDDIFKKEEAIFASHTSQSIAACDRLWVAVKDHVDKAEKRHTACMRTFQGLQGSVTSLFSQNVQILGSMESKILPVVQRHEKLLAAAMSELKKIRQLLAMKSGDGGPEPEVGSPTCTDKEAEVLEPEVPLPPPPDPPSDLQQEHWVTLDDGTPILINPL